MSINEPHPPVLGSHAPKTIRCTRAPTAAPAHIAQGSNVTTRVHPSRRHPSPTDLAAARSASTSACAVGSPSASRRLTASATTLPCGSTTRAATGTSAWQSAGRTSWPASSTSSANARRTNASSEAAGEGWGRPLPMRATRSRPPAPVPRQIRASLRSP